MAVRCKQIIWIRSTSAIIIKMSIGLITLKTSQTFITNSGNSWKYRLFIIRRIHMGIFKLGCLEWICTKNCYILPFFVCYSVWEGGHMRSSFKNITLASYENEYHGVSWDTFLMDVADVKILLIFSWVIYLSYIFKIYKWGETLWISIFI